MRNKVGILLLTAILLTSAGALGVLLWTVAGVPVSIAHGVAEIPGTLTGEVYSLDGSWEFFPGRLMTPNETGADDTLSYPLSRSWRDLPQETFEGRPSMATYSLRINGLRGAELVSFWLPPLRSAGRLWIDGREHLLYGAAAADADSEKPVSLQTIITVPVPENGSLNVTLQISSFHHFTGGAWESPFLMGDPEQITIRSILRSALSLFVVSSLLVTGLLFLMLTAFSFRWEHLFFSLFASAAILRVLVTEDKLLLTLMKGSPWQFFFMAEYFSLFLGGIALGLYIRSRYKPDIKTFPLILYSVSLAGLTAAYFFISPGYQGYLFLVYFGLTTMLMACFSVRLIKRFIGGDTSAGLHFLGILLLLGLGVNDFLLWSGYIHSVYLFSLGLLFFSFLTLLDHLLSIYRSNQVLKDLHTHMHTADRLKEHILAHTSHELRTPIHGIVGLSESLLRGAMGDLTEDQKSTLSLVFSSGIRLNAMVNDILDFSKIQEGGLTLRSGEVDLSVAADIVRKMCVPLVMGNDVELENTIEPHSVFVRGDENRLEQILYNLFGTAIRFSEKGRISISAEADEKKQLVSVSITATGIKNLTQEKVDRSFRAYQEDDLTLIEGFKTAGLSLAISRILIELHGGTLKYSCDGDESPGIFTFKLPLGSKEAVTEGVEALELSLDALENLESLDESYDEGGSTRFNIIVVDDNPVNLQVIKNQLSDSIYRVMPFLSGEEMLKKLGDLQPDLILLDIMMPGMNGYEVCRHVRQTHPTSELPIILVTAKSEAMDMEEGLKAGANDFLAKPYTQEELLVRVKTHLNLARTNSIYSRFVPVEFLEFLGHENIVDIQLGDQVQKEMTVLFVDIRAFTNLSESMTPQENFKFINSFLSRLSPMIQENGGIIDKYIGDSIMALFPSKPEDAIRAAQDMVGHMELYNKQRATCGYRPISIGVGIHTGNLILGIIGDKGRMQGTVISDAVNLASRIQDVTKLYGANIIISQESFIKLENPTDYGFRFLGKVRVKGKNSTVSLFEIFDGDPEPLKSLKNETKTDFEEAILAFSKKDFDTASDLFRKIIAANPDDRAARLFMEKAEAFIAQEKRRFLFTG